MKTYLNSPKSCLIWIQLVSYTIDVAVNISKFEIESRHKSSKSDHSWLLNSKVSI